MARGSTLNEVTLMLRVLLGQAVSPSAGTEFVGHLHAAINMAQETLYDKYDWRIKHGKRDKTINAGQRYYDFPSDLPPENVETVHVLWNGIYVPLEQGIGAAEYNTYNSDDNVRSDPTLKWDVIDTGTVQFEVWPLPATASEVRFTGKIALVKLVAGSDVAVLDDNLIAYTAAAILAKDENRAAKYARMAQDRMTTLRGILATRDRVIPGEGALGTRERQGTTINVTYAP